MAQFASNACDICMSGPGHNYCEQCNQWLCDYCKMLHLRSKISRSHTFLNGTYINQENNMFCKEHGENFICYCTDCDLPICKMCIVRKHQKHDLSEINEWTRGLQSELKQIMASKMRSVKANLETIEKGARRYQSDVKVVIRTITEDANQMKLWIDKKVQALVSSIEKKKDVSLRAVQSVESGFRNDMRELKKSQSVFNDITTITDVIKLLEQLQNIKSELNNAYERHLPVMPNLKYYTRNASERDIIKLFGEISSQ